MKYRIMKRSEDIYYIQKKWLWMWHSICDGQYTDFSFLITFKSVRKAEEYIEQLRKIPLKDIVIKEIEK